MSQRLSVWLQNPTSSKQQAEASVSLLGAVSPTSDRFHRGRSLALSFGYMWQGYLRRPVTEDVGCHHAIPMSLRKIGKL